MMQYKNAKADLTDFAKKTMFFITAFIPLWAILIINYALTKDSDWYVIFGFSIFVISVFIIMVSYLRIIRKDAKEIQYFKVEKKENITNDMILYIFTYIPILILNQFELKQIITFAILLFTIYVLYLKINMIHINPMFVLMRYNTYKITDDHDNTVTVLSKLNIKSGIEIPYREITDNVYMVLDNER